MPTPADFTPFLGQAVRFGGSDLVLTEVDVASERSFSLILQGPRSAVLPEGLHEARVGEQALGLFYIAPIHSPKGDCQDYQVVFG